MTEKSCRLSTGGDDLKLKLWDIRVGYDQPVQVNKRYGYDLCEAIAIIAHRAPRFDAGITSIQSHPHIEHVLAVGR